eukprot:EG_transcript_49693
MLSVPQAMPPVRAGRPAGALQADRMRLMTEAQAAVIRLARRSGRLPTVAEVWEDMEVQGRAPPDYDTQPVPRQYPPSEFLSDAEAFAAIEHILAQAARRPF